VSFLAGRFAQQRKSIRVASALGYHTFEQLGLERHTADEIGCVFGRAGTAVSGAIVCSQAQAATRIQAQAPRSLTMTVETRTTRTQHSADRPEVLRSLRQLEVVRVGIRETRNAGRQQQTQGVADTRAHGQSPDGKVSSGNENKYTTSVLC
jgi:hypothetical protein